MHIRKSPITTEKVKISSSRSLQSTPATVWVSIHPCIGTNTRLTCCILIAILNSQLDQLLRERIIKIGEIKRILSLTIPSFAKHFQHTCLFMVTILISFVLPFVLWEHALLLCLHQSWHLIEQDWNQEVLARIVWLLSYSQGEPWVKIKESVKPNILEKCINTRKSYTELLTNNWSKWNLL